MRHLWRSSRTAEKIMELAHFSIEFSLFGLWIYGLRTGKNCSFLHFSVEATRTNAIFNQAS